VWTTELDLAPVECSQTLGQWALTGQTSRTTEQTESRNFQAPHRTDETVKYGNGCQFNDGSNLFLGNNQRPTASALPSFQEGFGRSSCICTHLPLAFLFSTHRPCLGQLCTSSNHRLFGRNKLITKQQRNKEIVYENGLQFLTDLTITASNVT
jgi:hypothetical protein